MAIKSLEPFLFERSLVGSLPIDALKNATLGIDVGHYMSRLLSNKREQFLDAIGGFPTSLKTYLESDFAIFEEYKIKPVFVFSGCLTALQLDNFDALQQLSVVSPATAQSLSTGLNVRGSNSASQRNRAWTQWQNLMKSSEQSYIDQPIKPHDSFKYHGVIDSPEFKAQLISFFIENRISYQVAPVSSFVQLAYLLENKFIDGIYGSTDLLLVQNIEKFIIGMEFLNKEFRFVEKSKVLKELDCTYDELVDISMAVGNSLQPVTLPPLQIYPTNKLFEIALDMVLSTATDFYAYQLSNAMDKNNEKYVDSYQKGYSSLSYMPVLKASGAVELRNNFENVNTSKTSSVDNKNKHKNKKPEVMDPQKLLIPNDVHEFISQRLPSEYYFYQSIGLVMGKLFETITTGQYFEEAPLDGGATNSYRKLVRDSVKVFKDKEIGLLTQPINRYYQIKQIHDYTWFAPDEKTSLVNKTTPSMFEKINKIIIKTDDLSTDFSFPAFITLLKKSENLSVDFISKEVIFPNSVPTEKKLSSTFDVLSTNLLRTLCLLDFFHFDTNKNVITPTKWGSVLLKLDELKVDKKYYETIFVLLTFLKLNVLKLSDNFQPAVMSSLSPATSRSYPKETSYISFLARLLVLYQIHLKPFNYHGPIDKQALTIREHYNFVNKNLDELYGAVLISSLTSGEFDRLSLDTNGWRQKIVKCLPFRNGIPNTLMAMMWVFFLQKYLHNGNSTSDAFALVSTEFSTYKISESITDQFEDSLKFLDQVFNVFQELSSHELIPEVELELFRNAVIFCRKTVA